MTYAKNFSEPEVLKHAVVVFSRNYLPIARVNMRRAIALLVTGRAEPIDSMGGRTWSVLAPKFVLKVPEHIRLTIGNTERLWKVPPVNRREVLRRDNHSCQYCGAAKHLTLDHVMPRSRGGGHSWENLVAACERCNHSKGNRTPAEAGMRLVKQPKAPMHPAMAFAEQFWRDHKQQIDIE
ncbi:HNH endonuclease [Thalassoporum mexicanum PCC 7367]|uniref:HNH endonuclease n=1 Tax=Thalassoporum mexicanum TaxID=3457544 RepID=UPI00029FDAA9|nr:HNH endonuclease [Pseudanabaena sp. PCC 7367]AFY70177.1 HNH endonuclease [Pseudanabaena sp. PCC 7367]